MGVNLFQYKTSCLNFFIFKTDFVAILSFSLYFCTVFARTTSARG